MARLLYQEVGVKVWATKKRYPRWVALIYVDGSNGCGSDDWPMFWGFSKRSVEARSRRWAARHKARWQRDYEIEIAMQRAELQLL